jgi:hypothetical protein
MRILRRVALASVLVVAAVIGVVAWSTYGAWPVPEGYAFPRHSIWGGPTALYEGSLRIEGACIQTQDGATIVWPPFSSLAIVDGEPVVRLGIAELRIGPAVRLGGGWYESGDPPPTTFNLQTCPAPYFLTTGVADLD